MTLYEQVKIAVNKTVQDNGSNLGVRATADAIEISYASMGPGPSGQLPRRRIHLTEAEAKWLIQALIKIVVEAQPETPPMEHKPT